MNIEYIKDYKDKELKQYVLSYFLVSVASVGFYSLSNTQSTSLLSTLFEMLAIDVFVGAISVLVIIINELWSNTAKIKLVYKSFPSDSIFTKIATKENDSTGFDFEIAKKLYSHLSDATANKQTSEWNLLLRKSKEENCGNVIEAQRMQLMTRDLCVSTVSLLIMNFIALIPLSFVLGNFVNAIKLIIFPIVYLIIMFFITKSAASKRANRLVLLVIKNDVERELLKTTAK